MNKKLKLWAFLMSIFVAFAVVSCNNDDDDNDGDNDSTKNSISAKWKISSTDCPYESFEFNKDGNYIVVEKTTSAASQAKSNTEILQASFLFKNNKKSAPSNSNTNLSPVHAGSYSISGNTITLHGFGVVDIIKVTADEFTFSFKLESTGATGEYRANKTAETISSSTRTELLCRSWTPTGLTLDISQISDEEKEIYEMFYGKNWVAEISKVQKEAFLQSVKTVLFSRAGTYLVLYEYQEAGLSEWKWANKEENIINYSWDNWEDNWENYPVEIVELTNSTLKVKENNVIMELSIK